MQLPLLVLQLEHLVLGVAVHHVRAAAHVARVRALGDEVHGEALAVRFDAERNSRLVWTDASGVPQRRFDTGAFLSRFRGSDVVIVGDSHSGIVHQSLSILLGCTQPQREWLLLQLSLLHDLELQSLYLM